jgi:hypothetical protein
LPWRTRGNQEGLGFHYYPRWADILDKAMVRLEGTASDHDSPTNKGMSWIIPWQRRTLYSADVELLLIDHKLCKDVSKVSSWDWYLPREKYVHPLRVRYHHPSA